MNKLSYIMQLISCIGFYVIAFAGLVEYIWIGSAWILFLWIPVAIIGWVGEWMETIL